MLPTAANFLLFLSAAFILAITPGPGIFYVMTRSLKGGQTEGIASALGTAVGGMGHVVAAALGLSVILATSAVAFNGVKYVGAAYLIFLGLKTLLQKSALPTTGTVDVTGSRRAFVQGIAVEVLNPKTALFFLAFIPQFVDPAGIVYLQFILLGTSAVLLNTSADFVVATLAGPIGERLQNNPRLQQTQRRFTGSGLIALGGYVALTGNHRS
ncbi:MAG: LysE family translocator [Caldilineaceae bacterium]|nr:LysE family translocator [Caldilineaceae bacterium]